MKLNNQDLKWCLRRLPSKLLTMLEERNLVVAGGFIRACVSNEPVSDIDVFASSKIEAEAAAYILGHDAKVTKTDNAFTITGVGRVPIQFIHRWTFAKATDIIPSFDFTIAKAAFWFANKIWESECGETFYEDLAAKRLVYTSPIRNEDAGGSLLRVLKFYQKGYRIPIDSLGSVIARLMSGVKEPGQLSEIRLGEIITGLLHEVDPNIDPTHISHLPSTKGESALEK